MVFGSFIAAIIGALGVIEDASGGSHHMSAGFICFWFTLAALLFFLGGIVQLIETKRLTLTPKDWR